MMARQLAVAMLYHNLQKQASLLAYQDNIRLIDVDPKNLAGGRFGDTGCPRQYLLGYRFAHSVPFFQQTKPSGSVTSAHIFPQFCLDMVNMISALQVVKGGVQCVPLHLECKFSAKMAPPDLHGLPGCVHR
jgi:hypothetical protein